MDETTQVDCQNVLANVYLDGKQIPYAYDQALTHSYVTSTGRAANVEGSIDIHAADEIAPTYLFSELPREHISVGAEWDSEYKGLSIGHSVATAPSVPSST